MSSFDVKNYPELYHLYLGGDISPGQGGDYSEAQESVRVTPLSGSANMRGGSPFVYLPGGQYTTANALIDAGIPPPKVKFVGKEKHAALKEITIQGFKILYYEYPSHCGHKCRLEIVGGPSFLENHLFEACKRSSSEKARAVAEMGLKDYVNRQIANYGVQLITKKMAQITISEAPQSPGIPAAEVPGAPTNLSADGQDGTSPVSGGDDHKESAQIVQESGNTALPELVPDLTNTSSDSHIAVAAKDSSTKGKGEGTEGIPGAQTPPGAKEKGPDDHIEQPILTDPKRPSTPILEAPQDGAPQEIIPDPDKNRDFDAPSEGQQRQEEIKEDLQEGLDSVSEIYKEQVGETKPSSSKGATSTKGQEDESPTLLDAVKATATKVQSAALKKVKEMEQAAQQKVKMVQDAAQEARLSGNAEAAHGKKQLGKAARLEKVADLIDAKLAGAGDVITLKSNDGHELSMTRDQAETVSSLARLKSQKKVIRGVDNVFKGTAKASFGHGVGSGAKRLGKEIGQAHVTGVESLASNIGSTAVDFLVQGDFSLQAAGSAAKEVVGDTAKGVGVQVAENVAHSVVKGALKEIAPQLAKKIPGVATINAVYSVGTAVLSAKTAEEAFANGASAGVDFGIQFGCAAAGQALIPVPFLGTLVGSAAGSAVIYGKNRVLSHWR